MLFTLFETNFWIFWRFIINQNKCTLLSIREIELGDID